MAVSAPPKGARKIADRPPPQPARRRMRRSRLLNFKRRATAEPMPAPIWAIGPSLPALPPLESVIIEANPLITGTRVRMRPFLL